MRVISEAEWRAHLARWPGGVVPPHHTLDGWGPGYLTPDRLVVVPLEPTPGGEA